MKHAMIIAAVLTVGVSGTFVPSLRAAEYGITVPVAPESGSTGTRSGDEIYRPFQRLERPYPSPLAPRPTYGLRARTLADEEAEQAAQEAQTAPGAQSGPLVVPRTATADPPQEQRRAARLQRRYQQRAQWAQRHDYGHLAGRLQARGEFLGSGEDPRRLRHERRQERLERVQHWWLRRR
ncbi:MAG TPA: hypothetical protein VNN09_11775 [Candidatus Competibacteraceae bacterium]|nr:hypothetical protein [Candidatus Competibacteraceae bacterium]